MSIAHEQILQKCGFPRTLEAVLGLHGIVVKCAAAIFFPMEDCACFNGFLRIFSYSFQNL